VFLVAFLLYTLFTMAYCSGSELAGISPLQMDLWCYGVLPLLWWVGFTLISLRIHETRYGQWLVSWRLLLLGRSGSSDIRICCTRGVELAFLCEYPLL